MQQIIIDLGHVDRAEPEARQVGHVRQQAADHLAGARSARQVRAVGCHVHARQHDFLHAVIDQGAHLLDDGADRNAARIAAPEGDDAKGAAVIATILDLDEGPHPPVESVNKVCGRLPCGHDVVHLHRRMIQIGETRLLEFLGVAQHDIDFRHVGIGRGVDLGGTAGHDDPRIGILAPGPADGLAGLALRLGCDGAGVDDHGVGQPGFVGMLSHDLGFIGIQTAAECDDLGRALISHGRSP